MSKHSLRSDNTCQNCGEKVEKRFCAHCGQENTETRRTFIYLLGHFIEDLTHYDGAVWQTLKYLLFRPAYLTTEYLSGKRVKFVPPVRLYIFISFVTFLLPYVLPDLQTDELARNKWRSQVDSVVKTSLNVTENTANLSPEENEILSQISDHHKSVEQLDSFQLHSPADEKMGALEYWMAKKAIHLQKYDSKELKKKSLESFFHNFPKALFIYMPLFAFLLWFFHGKKRWLYFDHAIFTLHYFSFMLLIFNLPSIVKLFVFLGDSLPYIQGFLIVFLFISAMIYFYVAHKKMYHESGFISFLKSTSLFILNFILLTFGLSALFFYSLFSIH